MITLRAITTKDTEHGIYNYANRFRVPAGTRINVTPASNLPESSSIRYWMTGYQTRFMDEREVEFVLQGPGIGFHEDDLILSKDSTRGGFLTVRAAC